MQGASPDPGSPAGVQDEASIPQACASSGKPCGSQMFGMRGLECWRWGRLWGYSQNSDMFVKRNCLSEGQILREKEWGGVRDSMGPRVAEQAARATGTRLCMGQRVGR